MLYAFLFSLSMLHTMSISSSLTRSIELYLAKSISYEAPNYAVSSKLLSLLPSSLQIFSSALSSQVPVVFVLLLMSETKFHTHKKPKKKYNFIYLNFYVFRHRMRRQNFRTEWQQALPEFNHHLIFWWKKYWFVTVVTKYLIFVTFFRALLVTYILWFLPCILMTRRQHIFNFLYVYL
jgi:hypothetical protein